jgi:hypothetical protein
LNSAIAYLHQALASFIAMAWSTLSWVSPAVQLLIVSAVFGVVMVLVFGKVSNQRAIRRVKTEISASLMEVFLFRRDMVQALKAQGSLFMAGLRYFFLAMGPVLILAIPFALVLGHLNLRFGARPLLYKDSSVLSVNVAKDTDLRSITLQANPGLEVVGPVRVPKARSVYWRVRPSEDGQHSLQIAVSGQGEAIKQVVESGPESSRPLGVYLSRHELVNPLLFPNGGGGFALPPGPIERIELSYPERHYVWGGMEFSWVSVFLIVSILAGLVGSRLFGISV